MAEYLRKGAQKINVIVLHFIYSYVIKYHNLTMGGILCHSKEFYRALFWLWV